MGESSKRRRATALLTGGLERLPPANLAKRLCEGRRAARCEDDLPPRHDGELQIPKALDAARGGRFLEAEGGPGGRRREAREGEGVVRAPDGNPKTARGGARREEQVPRPRARAAEGGRRRRRRRARRDRRGVAAARRERCAGARRAAGRPGGVAAERADVCAGRPRPRGAGAPRDDRPVEVPRRRHRAHAPGEGPRLCAAPEDAQRARGRRGGKGRGGAPKGEKRAARAEPPLGTRPKGAAAATAAAARGPSAAKGAKDAAAAGGASSKGLRFESEVGRGVWRAIFGQPPKPNRPLLEGRLLYSFGLKAEDADVPNSVVRAEDEIGVPRRGDRRLEAGLPPQLLARLTQVLTYSTAARGGPGGAASAHAPHRKPKKPKQQQFLHALAMRPLPARTATAPAAALAAAPPAFADADALPSARPPPRPPLRPLKPAATPPPFAAPPPPARRRLGRAAGGQEGAGGGRRRRRHLWRRGLRLRV